MSEATVVGSTRVSLIPDMSQFGDRLRIELPSAIREPDAERALHAHDYRDERQPDREHDGDADRAIAYGTKSQRSLRAEGSTGSGGRRPSWLGRDAPPPW